MQQCFNLRGDISVALLGIIIGVVILFIGIFLLANIEPMFETDTCEITSYAGSPEIALNGSANESKIQNYTILAVAAGYSCDLITVVENISASGGNIYVRNPTGTLIQTISTIPAINSTTNITQAATSAGVWEGNYTYVGTEVVNITTGSYMQCCSDRIRDTTRISGLYFDQLVTATGTIFAVLGLVLIVVGLAFSVGALKNMM